LNIIITDIKELMGIMIINHNGPGKIDIYRKSKSEAPFSITKSICLNDWINQIIEKKIIVIFIEVMETCLKI
tara:strand:- start:367 stop:582 length:216 start_codon:yes stop_codon:yes gene_type:complete